MAAQNPDCPMCQKAGIKTVMVRAGQKSDRFGRLIRDFRCPKCGHRLTKRL